MKRVICFGVVGLLVVFAVVAGAEGPFAELAPGVSGMTRTPPGDQRAQWDLLWSFNTIAGGQPGTETDGTNIYTAAWASDVFARYQMDGTWVADFTIAGAANIRDLAYDGTYFYGSPSSLTIYIMDFVSETLIGTIPVTCAGITGVRHIAYDPTLDGGAGGFWIGGWSELGAITMSGAQIYGNIAGNASCYGSAYDPYSDPANPRLLLFQQTGTGVDIHGFDINSQTFTGLQHSATDVPGFVLGLAGGLAVHEDTGSGMVWLIGNIQEDPINIVFAYELGPVPVELTHFSVE